MKHNILRLFICLALALGLILGLCACQNDNKSDTGSTQTNTNTNTDTSTDTSTDTDTDTSSDAVIQHTVIFFIGSEQYGTQLINDGETVSLPKPTKQGFTLSPWKCGGVEFDPSTPISKNMVLIASWVPVDVIISFDKNGGVGEMDTQKTKIKGAVSLNACSFTRQGYTFKGWATKPDGDVFYKDQEVFYAGTVTEYTLYAVWQANTNKLYLDSCTPLNPDIAEYEIKTDDEFTLSCEPYREYHKFLGWSKTRGGVVDFELNDIYKMGANDSYTLYAVWEALPVSNQAIDVIKNDTTDYVIIYQKDSAKEEALANALAKVIKDKYGITVSCFDSSYAKQEKEIIIGGAREQGYIVSYGIDTANDFYIGPCENDLVLYAPNEFLYDYMLEIASAEFFNGNDVSFSADGGFKYASSSYKSLNYAQYYMQKNGSFDYNKLLNVFSASTYLASDGTSMPYRIYVPSNYDPSKPFPVVTVLHGAGERGTDNSAQLKNMVAKLFNQENSPYLNSIVIAPQCPWTNSDGTEARWVDWNWEQGNYSTQSIAESNELNAVYELLSGLNDKMATDTSRYYIMGLSMGGFGTWDMLARHGDMFAGAVAICGGGDPSRADVLKDIPIYVVHGTNDPSVPFAGSQGMVAAIENAGGAIVEFDIRQGANHFVWDYVGESTDIAKWLFSKSK